LQDSSISSSSAKDVSHYGKDWWFNFMNPSRIEIEKSDAMTDIFAKNVEK
jgi:hypothetical protein